jgi:hypothetical protein
VFQASGSNFDSFKLRNSETFLAVFHSLMPSIVRCRFQSARYGRDPHLASSRAAQDPRTFGYCSARRVNIIHEKHLAASNCGGTRDGEGSAQVLAPLVTGQADLRMSRSENEWPEGAAKDRAPVAGAGAPDIASDRRRRSRHRKNARAPGKWNTSCHEADGYRQGNRDRSAAGKCSGGARSKCGGRMETERRRDFRQLGRPRFRQTGLVPGWTKSPAKQ